MKNLPLPKHRETARCYRFVTQSTGCHVYGRAHGDVNLRYRVFLHSGIIGGEKVAREAEAGMRQALLRDSGMKAARKKLRRTNVLRIWKADAGELVNQAVRLDRYPVCRSNT